METLKKYNYVLNRKQKIQAVGVFLLILVGTILELVGVSVVLPFVNIITTPDSFMNNRYVLLFCNMFNIKEARVLLFWIAIALIVVYIVKNIYICVMNNVLYAYIYNNQRKLAYEIFDCCLKQPYLFFVSNNSAEMIRTIACDVGMFYGSILAVLQLFTEISVCGLLLIVLIYMDKSITIGIAIMMVIFVFTYMKLIKQRIFDLSERAREDQVKMTSWIQQAFGGIKEIKILGREKFFIDSYDENFGSYSEASRKFVVYSVVPKPLLEALCVSGLMGVIAIKLYRGVDLTYFIPTLAVFAIAAFRILPSVGRIAQYINNISYNSISVDIVYRNKMIVDELEKRGDISASEMEEFEMQQGIFVRNVCFKYPERNEVILNNVSIDIPKNKSVAFIGPSGAGKTTLADVILGVLAPESGHILADDIDVYKNIKAWNKHLGYIPQTIFLTEASIKENIAFGIPKDEIDEERIWEVLEDAQLKEFVLSLEDGLETQVGERGTKISGGQRQRVGIARALYTNPDVLVLDEATSALDTETETAVMEAIDGLSGKKTIIIIAHRLSTIRNCDIVYEVSGGSVTKKSKNSIFEE